MQHARGFAEQAARETSNELFCATRMLVRIEAPNELE
jgi:hypothetical protein